MATAKIFALGMMYDWPSASITIKDTKIYGITKISYEHERKLENNMGAGEYVVGRGSGGITAQGSITLYTEEYERLRDLAPNGDITMFTPFDIPVTFFNDTKQTTDVLKNVQFLKAGTDVSSGDTKVLMECPLIMSHVDFNK